jgi:flagellar biosynthetic protein FliQ
VTPETVIELVRGALQATFWLAAPLLAIGLLAGIVVSLLQVATSMQDNAVGAIPRLVAFLAGLLLFLPWMLQKSVAYASSILGDLARYAH